MNYEKLKWNPAEVLKNKPFINKCNWEGISYPSKIDDSKTFETNNPTIALNTLYIKEKEIYPAYISKINSNCEKQIILVMIPNVKRKARIFSQQRNSIINTNNIKTSW